MSTRPRKHKLGDVIAVAIRAAIAGADNRGDIESFGNAKIDRFETFLEIPNGIPSHDAFGRVFSLIDTWSFQDIFIEWTNGFGKPPKGRQWRLTARPSAAPPTGGAGDYERRGDDRIHAVGGLRDYGSQAALHIESAG